MALGACVPPLLAYRFARAEPGSPFVGSDFINVRGLVSGIDVRGLLIKNNLEEILLLCYQQIVRDPSNKACCITLWLALCGQLGLCGLVSRALTERSGIHWRLACRTVLNNHGRSQVGTSKEVLHKSLTHIFVWNLLH